MATGLPFQAVSSQYSRVLYDPLRSFLSRSSDRRYSSAMLSDCLQLPGVSPGATSSMVAPVLLKYRVCRPRLLLAGSRAEVDPAADVGLLHGEVLLIEDSARQYDPIGGESIRQALEYSREIATAVLSSAILQLANSYVPDTDRKYRATEKLLHAEDEYHEALCSAKELYARPLARNYPDFHDVIFQPLADLSVVTAEHCQRVSRWIFQSCIPNILQRGIRQSLGTGV